MFPDSPRPDSPAPGPESDHAIKPSDEVVVRALFEIEKATTAPQPSADSPIHVVPERSLFAQPATLRMFMAILGLSMAGLAYLATRQSVLSPSRNLKGAVTPAGVVVRNVDAATQAEAEQVLSRVAAGEQAAADEVLAKSSDWTGKTHRTAKSEQYVSVGINSRDLHTRAAALQAELALDGIPLNDSGLTEVERNLGNPEQRVWALWMLGALGSRGVDPAHVSKIVGSYLTDPRVDVRASAVDALALVATDETVPLVLDRFRNDPSPIVQERAACDVAESGMYSHEQRMAAAASLIPWLDDSLLSPQQHVWTVQALGDISGQRLGDDSAAWRTWYEGAH